MFEKKKINKLANINQRYLEQLDTYGMSHRYIRWEQDLNESILKPIDYDKVESIFQQKLSESKNFLNQIF